MQTSHSGLREIQANGVRLTYVEQGRGDPVVLVHGHFIDYRSWHFQIGPFSEHYRVVAYNRRYAYPNGRTGDYSDNTIANNAADLLDLLRALKLGPAHVVTVSTGSFIALYLAVRHPELVKSMVVMDAAVIPLVIRDPGSKLQLASFMFTHPGSATALISLNRTMKSANAAYRRGETRLAAQILANDLAKAAPLKASGPPLFDRLPPVIRESFIDNVADLKQGIGVAEDPVFTAEDAHKINVPVLLIRSSPALDPIVDKLARSLPNAEVTSIKHAGDQGRWFPPYPFTSTAMQFLAKHT
jgi:non-heme chloroperoxidase